MTKEPGDVEPFLLGVNYWPAATAMAMWSRFDRGLLDDDFAHIAALRMEVVRFFLLWEAFQPDPDTLDTKAFARFDDVLACAARHGLRTMPTLFCGHMSGANWLPAWTLDSAQPHGRFRTICGGRASPLGAGDTYGGPLLAAQRRFARAIGERTRGSRSVLAWDLGNEFTNVRRPASAQQAHEWSAALTSELLSASGIPVTGGTHGEDLTEDRRLRLSSLCAPWTFATMHGYPAYSTFARGTDDPEVVPFLAALARGFSRKPLVFTEFGNPACSRATIASGMGCLEEEAMADYASAVLEHLHARGALGALWWCWTDYSNELAASPPFDEAAHELTFGIVRADGTEKPVARALAGFAAQRRSVLPCADRVRAGEEQYYAGLPEATLTAYAAYLAQRTVAGEPAS